MHLILNAGNQRKGIFIGVDGNFTAIFGDSTGAVPIVLDHAEYRYVDTHFLQQRQDRSHMSFAAVQKYQIRQTAEPLA